MRFFSTKNEMPLKNAYKSDDIKEKLTPKEKEEDKKAPLFRCIYIDPETSQVVSVGHRDFHTLYRTNDFFEGRLTEEEIREKIEKYKESIRKITEVVRDELTDLKKKIKEEKLDNAVVRNLLLNLRYVVKHVAFKEEQECRIVKIESLSNKDTVKFEEPKRFYIEYNVPMKDYVKKIYFGPKATNIELFKNLLAHHDFKNVTCQRSTSPLA